MVFRSLLRATLAVGTLLSAGAALTPVTMAQGEEGGGGSVILLCNNYVGTLTIDVQGGRGGNCSNQFCSCLIDHGPGGGGYVAFSTAAVPAGITTLTSGGANGIELTPEGENANGCDNTSRSNCIPAGPNRYNRGATPGTNGGIILNVAYDGLYPCPAARIALEALSLEVSPLHALFVQYAAAGLPAEARLRFTLETPTLPLIHEETAPQGRLRFPRERPGRYLLRLEALTDQGSHRLLKDPSPINLPIPSPSGTTKAGPISSQTSAAAPSPRATYPKNAPHPLLRKPPRRPLLPLHRLRTPLKLSLYP